LNRRNWVHRWDVITGKEIGRRHFALAERVYTNDPPARFSPDGTVLAGMLKDDPKKLRFWDVTSVRKSRRTFSFTESLYDWRWSSDGKTLFAMVLPYGVETWDLATGKKKEPMAEPDVKTTKTEIVIGDPKKGQQTEVKQSDGLGAEIIEVTPDGRACYWACSASSRFTI